MNIPFPQTLAEALGKLVGEMLGSVEFVADYVQLRFNGPCVTADILPTVIQGHESLGSGQNGYRDALCEQIGYRVQRVEVNDVQVLFAFENGVAVSISLREHDYRGPEALEFWFDKKDRIWVV